MDVGLSVEFPIDGCVGDWAGVWVGVRSDFRTGSTELLAVIEFVRVLRSELRQVITSGLEHTPPKTIR